MNTKKLTLILILGLLPSFLLVAQTADTAQKKEKTKKGFSFGAVPAISYDSDMGFRYGALANFYDYGDGTIYPFYKHSLYIEWSHTTKGNDLKQIKYDSEYLIPGIRVSADVRFETEQAMDFYGFNGFQTAYNPAFTTLGNADYISRMFYKMDRRLLKIRANFQGKIIGRKLRWIAGFSHYSLGIDSVNVSKLNKGKEGDKILPKVDGLYDSFVKQGIIPVDQAKGGEVSNLTLGIVADTRDNEPNANRGIWSEALLVASPGFLWNDNPFCKLVLTHRQYFTLFPDRLTFAYRLNYQTSLGSKPMPWYMLNYTFSSTYDREGMGGWSSLRGILRNRVVGEGFAMGNFELRWKFVKFQFLNQNWYLALSPFVDMAMITKPYKPTANFAIPQEFLGQADGLHLTYGCGFHVALNQNFIVAVDYGMAANKNDGKKGLYIGLDFL
ncbi:MAG: BamA/TamA family outer membrane protein, partial [Bacteroidia bacterium]|nr:BamA/TamA family outer membrane protein [Bacteroidia bacterium]